MLQSLFSVTFDRPGGACSGRPFVDVAQITSSKAEMVADVERTPWSRKKSDESFGNTWYL